MNDLEDEELPKSEDNQSKCSEDRLQVPDTKTHVSTYVRPKDLQSRIRYCPVRNYDKIKKSDEMPFHLPHKKFMRKIEERKETAEPLTGFLEKQEEIRQKIYKPYYAIPDVQDPPIETPRKSWFIRQRTIKIEVQPAGQVLEADSTARLERLSEEVPVFANQLELINNLRNNPKIGFYYMKYAVERSSRFFNPYALKVVPYKEVDKVYMTIGQTGVTQYSLTEMSFTPLELWEREYRYYLLLTKIKTFAIYIKWKSFFTWKKIITFNKIKHARTNLKDNLFICDMLLCKAIMEIKGMCSIFLNSSFVNTTRNQNLPIFHFIELQFGKLEEINEKLVEFRRIAVNILNNSCLNSLLQAGFTPDDSNITFEQTAIGKLGGRNRRLKDADLKMSYIEQANKRVRCNRLARLIHVIDFYQLFMLYNFLYNSYAELIDVLEMHSKYLPPASEYENLEVDYQLKSSRPSNEQYPYFVIDLIVKQNAGVILDPSEEKLWYIINTFESMWADTMQSIKPFLSDKTFHPFTRPLINDKIEEPTCGEAPDVIQVCTNDKRMQDMKRRFYNVMELNFTAVKKFSAKFKHIYEFFQEDMEFSNDEIRNNRKCDLFRKWSERYRREEDEINSIVEVQPLGIFYIKMDRFRITALPGPNEKQAVLAEIMPLIGKEKVDALLKEAKESIDFLESEPVSTEDYVAYIKFVDKAQAKVDNMEAQLDYVKELYDIMEEYGVPVGTEDMANYLGISVYFTTLRLSVDKCLDNRTRLITKFNSQIQKDINALVDRVQAINDEATQPWLLDSESSAEVCLEALNELNDRLTECTKLATDYRSHQKAFKVEMTRFEILEQVLNDVKLRILLWDSMTTWDITIAEWYEMNFNDLDVEEMNNFVTKNLKNVVALEKGLPANNILPVLKEKVETMKDKLPIVGYLRNPNLRLRHWQKIEQLLEFKQRKEDEEPMTLREFEQLGAFGYPNELMEIASAASSEFGLELMLQKIEDSWKTLELIVLPHKDAKDVFVLGSLEEVQATLDDSNISIQTIAASRFVGPIKPMVDEWLRSLDLFSKTLEAWQYCQSQWLYLEAIFSAPDIQRQLPIESKLFIAVDKSWKEIMRKAEKMPLALENCTAPGLYEELVENNNKLDQIMKCLEAYLETKRIAFPRFFFLSNDELLEILAQTRNPQAVQRHLQKCFDAIFRLQFGPTDPHNPKKLSNDILAMISPEGEVVDFAKGLKARGNVEDWLGKVELAMFASLKKNMIESLVQYKKLGRKHVIWNSPSQVVLTVSQIFWAAAVHKNLENRNSAEENMKNFEKKCFKDLNELAGLVRGELPKLVRDTIINLITVDVHARDTISLLVENRVVSSMSFDWTKALRYHWDETLDTCVAKMSNAEHKYGYEYLGAQRRLVITPLTDRCYLCLMGALQLDLGGAPAGPAGTGKTETTKDLGKALAIQCVVFNCSEGLDYKMMGRFFSGLATSGAWCCFDEFNRIDIEVLSVIAQQLITIRNAKLIRAKTFMFEGRKIKLVRQCAAFITMNPGYAGRTELPDNLKSLFRPISMMVPDYKLIAEVTLYSEGFESSKPLSIKMTLMYTLCSEQLSQQDHYDFGMRAVKSVLVMAGSLKRDNPDKAEDVVLLRALRDSNLPKFLADDAELFQGILGDLFPGTVIPEEDYGILQQTAIKIMKERQLQPEACSIKKVIQLHETMRVRHGVMTVGPTGAGKTTILEVLRETYTRLHKTGVPGPYYRTVHMFTLNPKAVSIGLLYGEYLPISNEWHDGLLGVIVRHACSDQTDDHQWIVCDGPVDAVWIENMNTVLDDNKMLCLANSERIKFTPYVHMIFEVADLAQASPATVSRCGMVYLDPTELKWLPRVKTWLIKVGERLTRREIVPLLLELFTKYLEKGFKFFRKHCDHAIAQVDISKADMLCALLETVLFQPDAIEKTTDFGKVRTFITQAFIYSYIWAVGGNALDYSRETFEYFVKDQFEENADARLPVSGDLWDFFINIDEHRMDVWLKLMPAYYYNPAEPFFEILVPTIDTVRFGFLMQSLLEVNKPVFFTGGTGVGKSVIAKLVLNNLENSNNWVPVVMNFSAQTSSVCTQDIFESKLEKKKKTVIGAPIGKRICVFVDDVNMPKLDAYGSQPPIELLRQILDSGGLYDIDKLFWKEIQDVVLAIACAPPGGGRNPMSARFIRQFGMLVIPSPTDDALKGIFRSIMRGFLKEFAQPIIDIGDRLVAAAVEVYGQIAEDLLPTPEKSHYIFNLRDLSKCIQGILQADNGVIREQKQMTRLFFHECLRVFHDRLINVEDKSYFYRLLSNICNTNFSDEVVELPEDKDVIITHPPIILFGDFQNFGEPKEERVYEEITELERFRNTLQDYLEDYCIATSKEMNLIFFMDAIEHLCRLTRILRSERGNGLLVGVGGMGKQSLTKLASHINGYPCHQIEVSRGYDKSSWNEDLRRFYFDPGCYAEPATFLFTDTQIVEEEFLEDINNTLNSGEVPNLFEAEELERAIIATRPAAKDAGIAESNRDGIYQFFIGRVRNHLHLVLCMSPVGDAFRRRCRMFPSLVNCCTIDWFSKWPDEALLSVAVKSISTIIFDEEQVEALASICVVMHESVEDMTIRFFQEVRRRYYTTPSSYLDLLKLYLTTFGRKWKEMNYLKSRITNGLDKLQETNETVILMKKQLIALGPQLKIMSAEVAKLMKVVAKQQIETDKVKTVVAADEAIAKAKADETAALEAEARRDLRAALPALEEAQLALAALNKNDINEIKVFNNPPQLVRFVMEAVCLLLGEKTDWITAKLILGDVKFLERLMNYEKEKITDKLLKKLQDYTMHKDFHPDIVAKQSKVCKSICIWVRAIDGYAKIFRIVEPKRKRLKQAEVELAEMAEILREKQEALHKVEKQAKDLQNKYDAAVRKLGDLEYNMALGEARLGRSGRLMSALADEEVRWIEETKIFEVLIDNLKGDIMVAAGGLAYFGAFTDVYRQDLLVNWLRHCEEKNIRTTPNFSLVTVLADPFEIRMWNSYGLPRDQVSTENAIMVTQAGRWPLMIDPQEQANRWIRNMEAPNLLKACKMTDANFMRIMEACIRTGAPMLLQEVGENLDPSLEPILLKQTFVQAGRTLIRLGENDIEYDENFKLYITTKMANPHYLPEICIKVTIVNFTVTPSGLEDQLLADVVRLEKPDLEKMANELVAQINADKNQLNSIEDKILTLLFSSEGNILDNEELIETLNESKETSAIIATRLVETEATEKEISAAREQYRSVANRGSVLYFVVANLAIIDPMYQFSLKYFNQIFNNVIVVSTKSNDLDERLKILFDEITMAVYTIVSRGLFERHKIVFSFMMNISILLNEKKIQYSEWNFLLRGPDPIETEKKPDYPTLTDPMWNAANYLAITYESFHNLIEDMFKKITLSIVEYTEVINVLPNNNEKAAHNWNMTLTDIQKLMLMKALKEEKLIFGITSFVKKNLGQEFVESPLISLKTLYADTNRDVPLVFVLSTGSDPFSGFLKFAYEQGFGDRFESISLGQGQGPIAEGLIRRGCVDGLWIFLQNCHLATSWMLSMENQVLEIAENPQEVHPEFRLFLSSMPSVKFPVSVLQNSVKVTNEPPKGLKANVKRAFFELEEDYFEKNELGTNWRRIVFGVCFFHAIIQERKKFGPLGWNIIYEFSDSDRECCLLNLQLFCTKTEIPWDALIYTTGEITYGGRITDNWDLRCLKTILDGFFSPKTLEEGYTYSPSGTYYCPTYKTLREFQEFIDEFPIIEDPEIFGMHENANIAYQLKESQSVILTIMDVQPKVGAGTEGKSESEIAYELADMIMERIALKIDIDTCNPKHLKRDPAGRLPSLSVVLLHEVERYNILLKLIHSSMENLQRAIKGFVVMSEELENVFKALVTNRVPELWHSANVYPSLKSLGSWIRDLVLRIDFIQIWLTDRKPISFWLSGLSFPQGFITGMLQTHARKYNIPIDHLKLDFAIQDVFLFQDDIKAAHDKARKEVPSVYKNLQEPEDGLIIHGLFIDAGRWDSQFKILVDANKGEMNPPLPAVHVMPVLSLPENDTRYVSPLYKTSIRAGVLSTTGHSTNFVMPLLIPSARPQAYWILKGTALLVQVTD